MDQSTIALSVRDFLSYVYTNFLYKIKIVSAINKWNDQRKSFVKMVLNDCLQKTISNSGQEILDLYKRSIPKLSGCIGEYSQIELIKSSEICDVYKAVFFDKEVIIKAYVGLERNGQREKEDKFTRELSQLGFNVPIRYPTFSTDHFLCIPMEKLPITLMDVVNNLNEQMAQDILQAFVPILQYLHQKHLCYVDFSFGNVAFDNNMKVYMIDFGALHLCIGVSPNMKTLRYCSIDAENNLPVTFNDDYESLTFLLLDVIYGPTNSSNPLNYCTKQHIVQHINEYHPLIKECYMKRHTL
jgi:serine/threonine protein kinase